jgi:hypothetical protein
MTSALTFKVRVMSAMGLYNKFFQCADTHSQGARFFRISVGLSLFLMSALRAFDTEFVLSSSAVIPFGDGQEALMPFYRPLISWAPSSDFMVWLEQGLLLICAGGLITPYLTRFFAGLALFFHLALVQRNPTLVYGAEILMNFWLFALIFIGSGRASGKKWLDDLMAFGIRLGQAYMLIVYAFSGLEKMKGITWWQGTALWSVLQNEQFSTMNFTFLSAVPVVLALLTHIVALFEVYFPLLACFSPTRLPTLIFGVFLHIGIALTMGLVFFSWTMLTGYFLFLSNSEYGVFFLKFKRLRIKSAH